MRLTHHKLTPPFAADFAAWYPYLREGNVPADVPWGPWLKRLFAGTVGGTDNCFFAARDEDRRRWVGVVWCCVSPATPELSHLGWFLVEEEYRGLGLGREILARYLADVEARGVQMVMLPTQVSNTRAVGMYQRRGWEITLAQPDASTRCWMVREPDFDYQRGYFGRRDGALAFDSPTELDYVGLDYLLCRALSPSRLLPEFAGRRRFCSFTTDWAAHEYVVVRQGGRPLGLGCRYEGGHYFDFWALDESVLAALAAELAGRNPRAHALISDRDEPKARVLSELGFRPRSIHLLELPDETVRLRRYAR